MGNQVRWAGTGMPVKSALGCVLGRVLSEVGYFRGWGVHYTRAVSFPRCWRPAIANSKRDRAALASRSAPPGRKYTSPHRLQTQAWIPASRTRTPSLSNSCAILRGRSRPPHSEHGFFASSIIASVHAWMESPTTAVGGCKPSRCQAPLRPRGRIRRASECASFAR